MNIKFLGELYNYCMLDSQGSIRRTRNYYEILTISFVLVIFDTLYLLITLGHSPEQDAKTEKKDNKLTLTAVIAPDPPTDCFRQDLEIQFSLKKI